MKHMFYFRLAVLTCSSFPFLLPFPLAIVLRSLAFISSSPRLRVLRVSPFPRSLAFISSSPRLRVLRVSLFPGSLAFIPSSPRLRVLRVSPFPLLPFRLFALFPFSRSCPHISSHPSGQNAKNIIRFHFITKSRLKNAEFPLIPASDIVI